MDVYYGAGPHVKECALSPPSLWRAERNRRNELSVREGRREVDPVKGGKCCSEKRRANNQGGVFDAGARLGEHMGTQRFNYAASRGAPWGAAAAGVCSACPLLSELGGWTLCGTKLKFGGIQEPYRRCFPPGCRDWAPGLTPFRWRRWSGSPARGLKCRRSTSRAALTPAAIGASFPVRTLLLNRREHPAAFYLKDFYAQFWGEKQKTHNFLVARFSWFFIFRPHLKFSKIKILMI